MPGPSDDLPIVGLGRKSTFLPELESVRGIAVLLVFAFHTDVLVRFPFIEPTSTLAQAFVRAGYTGVDLFFVLSAFLLSLPFLVEAKGGRRVGLRDYFMRRALRILPLYFTAVLVGTVLCAKQPGDLRHALPYLLFLNWLPRVSVALEPYSTVWWSLTTELQFYLLLPLLPLFLRSRPGRWAGVLFLATYAVAYAAMVRGRLHMGSVQAELSFLNSVFGRGPLFLSGIAAAAIYQGVGDWPRRSRWLRLGVADGLLLTLVVVNAVFLRWLVSIGGARQMAAPDQAWHIVNGALWAAFILLLLLAPLRLKALFSNRALARLGILSYSVYLVHHPFMKQGLAAIRRAFPHHLYGPWSPADFTAVLVLSTGCLGLSALTYRFIERPFLVRKARFDS
jgi:peptidoglycan/LPS O-acetylase OafA/YrhL